MTPNFSPGDAFISLINTGIGGDNCQANTFCSYACPAGYQKSQWPTSQGNTGQSIGGLYCNAQGKLELTNSKLSKKICIKGTGEVKVKNTINKNVPICRTDYPGTESETVALDTQPGQEYELTCPDANKYYTWGSAATSAQYYINPSGSPVEDACRWNEAGSNMGNWAPVNLGVGKGPTGQTYISIFANKPTNPDGKLNFNLKITGDVSGKCAYVDGEFYNNGVVDPSGCTVSLFHPPSPHPLVDNQQSSNTQPGPRHRHRYLRDLLDVLQENLASCTNTNAHSNPRGATVVPIHSTVCLFPLSETFKLNTVHNKDVSCATH